jgi:gluconate 2-dehydrogenase gamma chain
MSGDAPRKISRRTLLKGVGTAGAAAVGAQAGLLSDVAAPASEAVQQPPAAPERDVREHLTAAEADTLNAIVARIIPTDDRGPGAREARAGRYIDRALGGALADSRRAYTAGLAAVDGYARSSRRAPFHQLSAADQDSLLTEVEGGTTPGFAGGGSAAFFEMVKAHTIQGTFGDPYYGGNANFVGWDLIGYPGIRTSVTPADQRMTPPPVRIHKSAYDYEMFTKASSASLHGARGSWRLG